MSKSKKRRDYTPKGYESAKPGADGYAAIYNTMITSAAWADLSPQACKLYVAMKAAHFSSKPDDVQEHFYFCAEQWANVYHLWPRTSEKSFFKFRDELIEHGFIRCVEDNQHRHMMNVYGLSDKWKTWGTRHFCIDANEMTASMKRKLKYPRPPGNEL